MFYDLWLVKKSEINYFDFLVFFCVILLLLLLYKFTLVIMDFFTTNFSEA